MTTPLFVAIEGLCCVGKSTVVGEVSAALGAVQLATVPEEYGPLRRQLRRREDMDARFLLFLSALCRTSVRIGELLAANQHVVVESYLARTVAFHRGMGSMVDVLLPNLLVPDVTFQLTCDASERRRRMEARGGLRHYWDELADTEEKAITDEYRRFPAHLIDTTTLTPGAVASAMLAHPLNGSCICENSQPLGRHQNLLSAVSYRTHPARDDECGGGRGLRR